MSRDNETENGQGKKGGTNISVYLSHDLIKKVEGYAEEHGLKKSQVVARALQGLDDRDERILKEITSIRRLIEEKQSLEPNPDEEIVLTSEQIESIDRLFEDCTPFFGGFEIEGDNGFLVQVRERELTGSIWIDEMLHKSAEKLSIGYDRYFEKPEPLEFINSCADAMDLSLKQRNKLGQAFAERQGLEVVYREVEEAKEDEGNEESEEWE